MQINADDRAVIEKAEGDFKALLRRSAKPLGDREHEALVEDCKTAREPLFRFAGKIDVEALSIPAKAVRDIKGRMSEEDVAASEQIGRPIRSRDKELRAWVKSVHAAIIDLLERTGPKA